MIILLFLVLGGTPTLDVVGYDAFNNAVKTKSVKEKYIEACEILNTDPNRRKVDAEDCFKKHVKALNEINLNIKRKSVSHRTIRRCMNKYTLPNGMPDLPVIGRFCIHKKF